MDSESAQLIIKPGYEKSFNHTPSFVALSAYYYMAHIGHSYFESKFFMKVTNFPYFLMLYTIRGKGHLNYRGKQYELCKGSIMLLDCKDYQEYYADKDELWETKWIYFNGSSSEEYYKIIYENYGPVIEMQNDKSIQSYIDNIFEYMENSDLQFEIKVSGVISQILTSIMLFTTSNFGIYKNKQINIQIKDTLAFIENNYKSNISVSDLAKIAGYNMFHFIKLFKRIMGYKPHEYVIKYRISKAKELLRSTNTSVEEVSINVGFDSPNNFIKTFKKFESLTPLKYRKLWEAK